MKTERLQFRPTGLGCRVAFLLLIGSVAMYWESVVFSSSVVNETIQNQNQTHIPIHFREQDYDDRSTIYGLIHMAKTAGTEINGMLALNYQQVCGNKGYSYDAVQANMRWQRNKERCQGLAKCTIPGDTISKAYPERGFNRGRFRNFIQTEIGYDDCDYIALEAPWDRWSNTVLPQLADVPLNTLELHVPCRKPAVDHLMSMCNYLGIRFDYCQVGGNPKRLRKLMKKCLVYNERYHPNLSRATEGNRFHYNKTVTVNPNKALDRDTGMPNTADRTSLTVSANTMLYVKLPATQSKADDAATIHDEVRVRVLSQASE